MRKQSPAFRFVRIGWREAATTPRTQKGAACAAPSNRKPLAECQLFGCGTILM